MKPKCTCLEMGINADLRYRVFDAERKFLARLARKGMLARYAEGVIRYRHTWGLCPKCDWELRRMVLTWRASVVS